MATPQTLRSDRDKAWFKATFAPRRMVALDDIEYDFPEMHEYVYTYSEAYVRSMFRGDPTVTVERLDVTYAQGRKLLDAEYVSPKPVTPTKKVHPPRHPEYDAAVAWLKAYTGTFDFLNDLKSRIDRGFTDRQIDAILKCKANDDRRATERAEREAARTSPARIGQDGWYKVGDTIYKVQRAVHGSGQLYAKRLDPAGGWEYAPGIVRTLTDDQRLTLEDAMAFGKLYGRCAVCGATLTDEGSIDRGIGPICAGKL